ncbi:MAG: DoxX family protein [Gammaproteobacteria bacterium]
MPRLVILLDACYRKVFANLAVLEGLAPLALRLFLVPVFWMAGTTKLATFSDTVAWFGNPDWGLGLPLPWLMAALATAAEVGGAVCLAVGLAIRLIAVPLMITMAVAAATVHWEHGWQAIADPKAPFANERVEAAPEKLDKARSILREHGNYEWLTSSGKFVVLNNGIEFAATYFVMLLALFFMGGGRYVSLDYWLARAVRGQPTARAPPV